MPGWAWYLAGVATPLVVFALLFLYAKWEFNWRRK